ncbi:MAG: hypothetical protein M1824_003972 [Vezdaea acicularis]|nr:MAG: hypothetical protein M1824_003972 [Vezdaea acicularis]
MDCMRNSFNEGIVLNGRYQTISPLNHGSFGMVFLANDSFTDNLVAVKCLTKAAIPSENTCPATFAIDERSEELECHTTLGSHPNIVNLLDSFESDAHIYLVLEFCSMGDLYEAIRVGRGPLETEHVREFMLQLVDAVAYMHSMGIYHRDIKPENIFLTQSGSMKLGDFGLATRDTFTLESTVGSDRYMSPEQYDPAGMGYSPERADVWAIGICLLNVLFSRNPFVTPTESDPLFADYVRDPQSLFDVFPTMSQDTYEVLVHSLALDPRKRSLSAVREALNRVITFTTDDEILDDFCTNDRQVVPPSANREPLRTPSISSPQLDAVGAFPWAKALNMSPQPQTRQLSAIPDIEHYSDDIYSTSVVSKNDWYMVDAATASVVSALDSGLGASLKSSGLQKASGARELRSSPMPISGSVPLPSMSTVFGQKSEMVSKSWSDLWDEEEEEEVERQRREQNSRSWSQDTHLTDDDDVDMTNDRTIQPRAGLSEQSASSVNTRTRSPAGPHAVSSTSGIGLDGVNENDGFFFEDHHPHHSSSPLKYSPPARRSVIDKWAALGERRRAYTSTTSSRSPRSPSSVDAGGLFSMGNIGSMGGLSGYSGVDVGVGVGVWDRKNQVQREREGQDYWSRDGRRLGSVSQHEWVGGWPA